MFIFFILGALVGSFSVVFVLQNTDPVSVTFLSSQIEGSLAVILTFTFLGGALTTILFFLPGLISDWIHTSQLKRQIKTLETDLEETKEREREAAARARSAETAIPETIIVTD
jgi:uncharacterized integral membrane protein